MFPFEIEVSSRFEIEVSSCLATPRETLLASGRPALCISLLAGFSSTAQPVGDPIQRLAALAKRVLPGRAFERLLMRAYEMNTRRE